MEQDLSEQNVKSTKSGLIGIKKLCPSMKSIGLILYFL